jgi:hypothetical protein
LQERSGAREHVRTAIAGKDAGLLKSESFISKLVGECNEIIAKYVPGARRAVVHTPPTIKVEANKKTFSLADFQKMAEAQGFKITVGE